MKAIVLLKRRPDLTHQQFRDHYEGVHSKLAEKYLGHLFLEYRRNYPQHLNSGEEGAKIPNFAKSPYDSLTEMRFPDRAAWDEAQRIMSDPVIGKIFSEDEERFMDRSEFRVFTCDEFESIFENSGPTGS